MDLTLGRGFEAAEPEHAGSGRSEQHAECIAHAHRCRQLAESAQSHSVRQMLIERANGLEARAGMFSLGAATD